MSRTILQLTMFSIWYFCHVCVLAKRVVSPIARPSPGTGKQSCFFLIKMNAVVFLFEKQPVGMHTLKFQLSETVTQNFEVLKMRHQGYLLNLRKIEIYFSIAQENHKIWFSLITSFKYLTPKIQQIFCSFRLIWPKTFWCRI